MAKTKNATTTNGGAKSLPQYSPPKSGVLSHVPSSWVPYGELARIDRPTGAYLFYLPHFFGTLYALSIDADNVSPDSLADLAYKNAILFFGTFAFRAAACAWNDTLDRDFDRQVLRCRLRPVARGAVSPFNALVYTAFLTLLALVFLYLLPESCWVVSLPSIFLLGFYPFTKRFMDFPQAVLGIQVAIGFFMGFAAMNDDWPRRVHSIEAAVHDPSIQAMTAFYLANACWTVVYDTVYAQQDVEDDARAGVRSMAVRFRGSAKALLWTVSLAEVGLLVACGILQDFGRGYMAVACGGTLLSLSYMLLTIDFTVPSQCAWWFRNGTWFVGSSISCGLVLEILQIT